MMAFMFFWKYFESAKFGRFSRELNIVAQFTECDPKNARGTKFGLFWSSDSLLRSRFAIKY